jgi:3-oxoacyl-[acyl-carrier protein] reductase
MLNGKVALITGGSRGIGAGIVTYFLNQGARVAFTYRSSSAASEALIAQLGAGDNVKAYQSDASDFDQAAQLIADVISDFGTIDILINNAGITRDNLLLRMSEEQWDVVMTNNLKSVFNLTKHIMRPMMKNRKKSIAKEVASRNIRCNAIAPGFIQTDMTDVLNEATIKSYEDSIPLRKLGTSDDIASTCAFLGSDSASYITGQVISVCGGLNI